VELIKQLQEQMNVAKKLEKKINRISEGNTFKYQQLDIAPDEYTAATKAIERLIAKEVIKRVSTGVFYKPKKTVFGELRPGEEEIIKPYLFLNKKRIAYITGISLYNRMGLTTQVPKSIKVASKSMRISINTGSVQAKPVKSYVDVTDDNYQLLEILDVLKDFSIIPDLDKKMAIKFLINKLNQLPVKELLRIIKYALNYPPRTRAFLGALLNEADKSINTSALKQSLNPLTTFQLEISPNLLSTAITWNIK
jgi:hypothetical protein